VLLVDPALDPSLHQTYTTMELHHSKLLRSMKEMISLRLWPSQLHRLGTLRPHAHHKSL
jgi:hypothetical protein